MSLTIEPTGGLANRLRTLDAALALGAASQVPVRLRWNVNRDMGGVFQQFFEVPTELVALENVEARAPQILPRVIGAARRRVCRYLDDGSIKRRVESGADFIAIARRPRPLYIRSCYRFFPSPRPYAWLSPVARLRASIDAYAGGFGPHTIGVHVRRTDHVVARERSPDDLFFRAIDAALVEDERAEFCLCTDDLETLERFRERYAERIIGRPRRQFGRDSVAAIDDAVIDVFSLARCQRILGSEWSSFSRLAAQLGGIERQVLVVGQTQDTPALWGPLV